MNFCKAKKVFGIICACAFFSMTSHHLAYAAPEEGVEASVEEEEASSGEQWMTETAAELEDYVKVQGGELLTKVETAVAEAAVAAEQFVDEQSVLALRQEVVDYALSFVGGRYVYGGNDPHTGVDCSGFTRYILEHAAGISMNRSSIYQASQGKSISAEEMQPGDLIFYGKGKSINHVAMYIGDGRIVHASTEKTGIKTSPWNYRTPVKIVSVIS